MGGTGRCRGSDRRGPLVLARTGASAAVGVCLPSHPIRHRTPRGDHRSSRWDAGVGSQILSTVVSDVGFNRESVVKNKNHENDETEWDRRGFLECMAWVGTGAIWTMSSGTLKGMPIEHAARFGAAAGGLRFVQISDSHIGFNKDANPDVTATLRAAIAKIHALPQSPSFVLHTGDLTHLSKPDEFDTLQQELSAIGAPVFYVPGEHDVLNDNGKSYLERFGKNTKGAGWYSFDQAGVHFIGLVNVVDLKAGGMGTLGAEQLEWLEADVKPLKSSTPIVVFAHIPLWSVYPEWGWGTDDSARALSYLKRFGSVSVLNGHIHQVMQKVEGHVSFHTAMSTAFPQPAPGSAP